MSVKRLNSFIFGDHINPATKRRRVFILFFSSARLNQVCTTVSGFRDSYRSPLPSTMQQSLRGRMDPAANPDIFALLLRGTNRHRQQAFTASLRSSNSSDTTPESRSDRAPAASCRLSQLRSRRNIQELLCQQGVGRNFTHHDDFQPFSPRFSP